MTTSENVTIVKIRKYDMNLPLGSYRSSFSNLDNMIRPVLPAAPVTNTLMISALDTPEEGDGFATTCC